MFADLALAEPLFVENLRKLGPSSPALEPTSSLELDSGAALESAWQLMLEKAGLPSFGGLGRRSARTRLSHHKLRKVGIRPASRFVARHQFREARNGRLAGRLAGFEGPDFLD